MNGIHSPNEFVPDLNGMNNNFNNVTINTLFTDTLIPGDLDGNITMNSIIIHIHLLFRLKKYRIRSRINHRVKK